MNQSTTKVRKGRSSEANKETQKTAKNNVVPKVNDIKADVGKQTDKSQILPTPEQLRIAQIIDMKTDDPYIKDKLKQVMDATQTSADDAYTALHDADNDINKAVNLLLEGGVKDEWSTLSKKKKARTVSEKSKENNVQPTTTPTENSNQNQNEGEDFENMVPIPVFNAKTEGRGGGRSGGRAFHKDRRGGRSGQNNANLVNSINEKTDKSAARGARNQTNGPSNKGSRSFRGGRQGRGSRGRGGGGSMFRRPIENWDDNLHQNDINNTPQAIEDWDSEEFTGSLANSQVFTASAPVKSKSSEMDMPPLIQGDQRSPIRTPPSSEPITHSFTSAQILTHYATIQQQLSLDNQNLNKNMARESDILSHVNSVNVLNSSLPLTSVGRSSGIVPSSLSLSHALGRSVSVVSSMSLSNRATSLIGTSSTNTLSLSAVVAGRNSLSGSMPPLPKSDVFGRGKSPLLNYSRAEENRLGRLNARGKPRIPPPSKIPLTAVEMPPDGDSSIGRLDVQFGAMDLGESSSDTLPNTPPSPQRSSPSPPPADNFSGQNNTQVNESLISSDSRSFSPVSGSVSNSLSNQLSDVGPTKISETTSSSLYQDTVYQSSLYTKSPQQHQGIYNSTYTTGQAFTTSSAIYSNTSTSQSSYSSTVGNYGTNSYPYNYPNYQSSHQATTQPSTNNHNSYQSANNQYGIGGSHSGYGNSSLATSSYTMPYQTYNNSSQHKASLPSAPSSKEYESPNPTVNLSSIAHTASISGTSTLLSSSQTTPTSKTTGSSTMSKGTMVANMPQPLVGTPQYIVNQGTMPYFQQQPTPVFYEDLQLMPQQRLPHLPGGYYEVGYQPSTTREYSLSDGRFARADTTSPVPSITQQSGSQAHQQQLMNPTMPPAYAYFYGGSVIPGNFSFSAPTIYPVAATGSTTGHGSSNTGSYGKGPTYTGSYAGMYENSQQNVDGYKSSASQVTKVQPTQSVNPSTSSDISNIYSKSHSALSKSYDKPGYCATPPPYNLGSQNSGIGPGGYPPHLFIPTLTPHHSTQLMHQPLHQDGGSSVSGRSQVNSQQNKQSKNNYSSYNWAQN